MKLQTLELNETLELIENRIEKAKKSLVRQKIFDGVFGIFLPAMCFLFDPIVFRGSGALLGNYKPFAYALSYVSIMSLLAFMLWGEKLKWLNGFLCGLFAVAAVISGVIGFVLFPFSLMGLVVLIGALGFTPLFTSFVFLRSAVRAFEFAKPTTERKLLFNSIALSVVFSITLPFLLNVKAQEIREVIRRGETAIRAVVR